MKSLLTMLAIVALALGSFKVMTTKVFANDRVDSALVCSEDSDPNAPAGDANSVAE